MRIANISASELYVICDDEPGMIDPYPGDADDIPPGTSVEYPGDPDGRRSAYYLYRALPGTPDNPRPFWTGRLRPDVAINVNPQSGSVTYATVPLTEADVQAAKALFPDDADVQALTLDELIAHGMASDPLGRTAISVPPPPFKRDDSFTECEFALATIALDIATLSFGLSGFLKQQAENVTQAAAHAVAGNLGHFRVLLARWPAATSNLEKFRVVLDFVTGIGKDNFGNLVKVLVSNLSVKDKIFYGALLLSEFSLLIITDGVWALGVIGFEMAVNGAFLFGDITTAFQKCFPDQTPPPISLPDHKGALYITSGPNPNRRLWPATNPAGVALLETGSRSNNPPQDTWKLEAVASKPKTFLIRHVASSAYVTASAAGDTQLILSAQPDGAASEWTVKHSEKMTRGYGWENGSGRGWMYTDGLFVLLRQPDSPDPGDGPFNWIDAPTEEIPGSNTMLVKWTLTIDPSISHWGFWNAIDTNPGVGIKTMTGTVDKPDQKDFWCVVAMTRCDGVDQGIAQVCSWTDADGPHVQVAFNARGSWNQTMPAASSSSTLDRHHDGITLTAKLIVS